VWVAPITRVTTDVWAMKTTSHAVIITEGMRSPRARIHAPLPAARASSVGRRRSMAG